ncbi:hypothetical protein [Bacteroides heparinolyticus]|uniref:hypothetical protein n=1 Tax=Prevotella heparinolytica TaxID=28113 RepID=UPI0035A01B35
MITSNIGKLFLTAYNEKYGKHYDAKTFFLEQYYPLFFDQNKYMMTAGNSPLENPKLSWEKMIKGQIPFETPEQRKERFENFINKVEKSEADASIAIGYPTLDINATTSGQVTNLQNNVSKDDIYYSWIGAGLGIGLQGGFSVLFSEKKILLDLFDGWKVYRDALNNTPNLRGNQINTWNGQWLAHRYSSVFVENKPMANFMPFSTKEGLMSIDVRSWTGVLIAMAKKHQDQQMMGYVYNYGQTNTTVGFIPFSLSQIRRPIDLYQKFFGMVSAKKAEPLWGTAFGFLRACQSGAIGLRAMEPKGLRDYIEKGKMPKIKETEEETINFNTYKIWIMAMLNNEDLWAKAQEFARELQRFVKEDKPKSTKRKNQVDSVLESINKKQFFVSITEIVKETDGSGKIEDVAKTIHLMPNDNVPYFLTLIRFHYATMENKATQQTVFDN